MEMYSRIKIAYNAQQQAYSWLSQIVITPLTFIIRLLINFHYCPRATILFVLQRIDNVYNFYEQLFQFASIYVPFNFFHHETAVRSDCTI